MDSSMSPCSCHAQIENENIGQNTPQVKIANTQVPVYSTTSVMISVKPTPLRSSIKGGLKRQVNRKSDLVTLSPDLPQHLADYNPALR